MLPTRSKLQKYVDKQSYKQIGIIKIKDGKIQPFQFEGINPRNVGLLTSLETSVENAITYGFICDATNDRYLLTSNEIDIIELGANAIPLRDMSYHSFSIYYHEQYLDFLIWLEFVESSEHSEQIEIMQAIKDIRKKDDLYLVEKDSKVLYLFRHYINTQHKVQLLYQAFTIREIDGNGIRDFIDKYCIKEAKNEEEEIIATNPIDYCKVIGNDILLPSKDSVQISPKDYKDLKLKLENIGGVYNTIIKGFSFRFNPTRLFNMLKEGKKVNIYNDYQYFPTSKSLIEEKLLSGLFLYNKRVLEPSAGCGNIAMFCRDNGAMVDCVEYMQEMREVLSSKGFSIIAHDFMTMPTNEEYDFIIANPPFSKGQDMKHVIKMYKHLKKGGVLRSIMSISWINLNNKASVAFNDWLIKVGGKYELLESGLFKEAGTNVQTCIVEITKK